MNGDLPPGCTQADCDGDSLDARLRRAAPKNAALYEAISDILIDSVGDGACLETEFWSEIDQDEAMQ
jgi:hypothetical protein